MADLQVVAGALSTLIFATSNLSMLLKAVQIQELGSYSLAQIGLTNLGNLLYWLYVFTLPIGPIWLLHGFYTVVALLMLGLYLHHEKQFFQRR
jgi:hypothetical protein